MLSTQFSNGCIVGFRKDTRIVPYTSKRDYVLGANGAMERMRLHRVEGISTSIPFAKAFISKSFILYYTEDTIRESLSKINGTKTPYKLYMLDNYKRDLFSCSFKVNDPSVLYIKNRIIDIDQMPPPVKKIMLVDKLKSMNRVHHYRHTEGLSISTLAKSVRNAFSRKYTGEEHDLAESIIRMVYGNTSCNCSTMMNRKNSKTFYYPQKEVEDAIEEVKTVNGIDEKVIRMWGYEPPLIYFPAVIRCAECGYYSCAINTKNPKKNGFYWSIFRVCI